jgi:hypothetical protein
MKIERAPFQTIDWSRIARTEHAGVAHWRRLRDDEVVSM